MSFALFEHLESLQCHPPRGPAVNRLYPRCSKAGSWRCGYESAWLSMQRWAVHWCANGEKTPAAAEALAGCYEDGSFSHSLTEVALDCCHHCQHRGSPKIRASFAFGARGAKTCGCESSQAFRCHLLRPPAGIWGTGLGTKWDPSGWRSSKDAPLISDRELAASITSHGQKWVVRLGWEWCLEPQHLQWDTCEKMVASSSCQDPNALEARIPTTRGDRTLPTNSLKKQPFPLRAGILPIPIHSLSRSTVHLSAGHPGKLLHFCFLVTTKQNYKAEARTVDKNKQSKLLPNKNGLDIILV